MAVLGPDVSHFQGTVDWAAVAAAGEAFAGSKATDGIRHVDPQFARNWRGIAAAGIPVRIAYHYGHNESSAVSQADHFLSTVGDLEDGDLLCLDAEDVCRASHGIETEATVDWIADFLARVVAGSGLPRSRVLLYTGRWWWNPRTAGSPVAAEHPLWLSDYEHREPPLPGGWSSYVLHQYTSKDKVPGIPTRVDRSRFNGSVEQLHALAGLGGSAGVLVPQRAVQQPPPDPAPAPGPVPAVPAVPPLDRLRLGATNDDVRRLQEALVRQGFPVVVDGGYGPRTRAAVAAFQRSRPELRGDPDGRVGPLTLRLLFS